MTTEKNINIGDTPVVCGERHVDPTMPVFEGHFPGFPLVPAATLLEWMLESLPGGSDTDAAWTVVQAKFTKAVEPGMNIFFKVKRDREKFAVEVVSSEGSHAVAKFRRDR